MICVYFLLPTKFLTGSPFCLLRVDDVSLNIFKENDHATFLLYESGMFKKSLQSLEFGDKNTIVQELKLYNCDHALKTGIAELKCS